MVTTESTHPERGENMSRFESFLTKTQDLIKDYYEFRNAYPYFVPESHTCTVDGGLHRGKHRKFKAEKENSPQKQADG
jgi:hypothetical protein